MCERHYYTNGKRVKSRIDRCRDAERTGNDCNPVVEYHHPEEEWSARNTPGHRPFNNLPPSPPLSDSSFAHSGSDAERANKRRSAIYVNGEKVVDLTRKNSRRERRPSNHVTIVESPASPRTPPRYESPVPSPLRSPTYVYETRPRQYAPAARPEVMVQVNDHRPRRESTNHYRHTPRPRHGSHSHESGSISDEEVARIRAEARNRQLERELKKSQEEARQYKLQSEIKRANEKIANRPAVPAAPPALKKASSQYRRGSVSLGQPGAGLADAMNNLRIREAEAFDAEKERQRRERRALEKREAQEAEAQRQRLLARMTPQRSATVSHGGSSRRAPKVYLEDPFYRTKR